MGRTWHDAAVFVMTKMDTDLVNGLILILSLSAIFVIFIGLLSAYGIIINQDNIRIGKVPDSVPLLWKKDKDGQKKHLLCFNLTVAGKLLPITLLGVLAVTGVSFYLQSVNSLSAIAYESNMTIGEIDRELENNINGSMDFVSKQDYQAQLDGEKYFQTFKRSGDSGNFVGTAVPLSTVYATRNNMTLTALILSAASFLIVFIYTCVFGSVEEDLYRQNADDVERRARNEQDLITITMPSGKKRRVRSAASRWDAEYVPWQQKTPEQKFAMIVKIVFYVFADLLFLCILLSRAGVLNINMINYVYEGVWRKGFNIFAMTNGLITLIVVFVVANLTEMLIDNVCVNIGSRAETLGHLFSSVIHYGVALFAVFYTLYLCGLDTGSLIASAGIMSLVIGLGAQSMIQDILAGVFIVFEGAFRVGDIVTIGDFRGNVMKIGLRTTKIEDTAKNIKVFNNSTLSGIINMTKETSVAAIDVSVAYGESLEHVEEVLAEELPKVRSRVKTILDGPYYKGVSGLSGSSVDLKIIAMCKEQSCLQLCRDLNRELLLIFNRNNINIPFPQVTVSYLDKAPSPEELQDARRFVAEQKEKERHGKD